MGTLDGPNAFPQDTDAILRRYREGAAKPTYHADGGGPPDCDEHGWVGGIRGGYQLRGFRYGESYGAEK